MALHVDEATLNSEKPHHSQGRNPHNPAVAIVLAEYGSRFASAATKLLRSLNAHDPGRDAHALLAVLAGLVFQSTVGGSRPYTYEEFRTVISDVLVARLEHPIRQTT